MSDVLEARWKHKVVVPRDREPMALMVTLRDMGNRVVRLEDYALVPVCAAEIESELFGRYPIELPLSAHIEDALFVALDELACAVPRAAVQSLGGCCRSVAPGITEFLVWLANWKAAMFIAW